MCNRIVFTVSVRPLPVSVCSTSCVSLFYFLCQCFQECCLFLYCLHSLASQSNLLFGREEGLCWYCTFSLSRSLSTYLCLYIYIFISLCLAIPLSLFPTSHLLITCLHAVLPEIVSFIYGTPLLPAMSGRNQKFCQ